MPERVSCWSNMCMQPDMRMSHSLTCAAAMHRPLHDAPFGAPSCKLEKMLLQTHSRKMRCRARMLHAEGGKGHLAVAGAGEEVPLAGAAPVQRPHRLPVPHQRVRERAAGRVAQLHLHQGRFKNASAHHFTMVPPLCLTRASASSRQEGDTSHARLLGAACLTWGSPPPTATRQCTAATCDMPSANTRTGMAKLHATTSALVSHTWAGGQRPHPVMHTLHCSPRQACTHCFYA